MRRIYTIIALIIFILLLAVGLDRNYTILNYFSPLKVKNIELFNLPENRLRFKVNVTANRKFSAYIKYWAVNSKDTLYTEVTEQNNPNTITLINTVANTAYKFQVVAVEGRHVSLSKVHDFRTKPIYQATPYFDLVKMDPSISKEIGNKYFLTQILTQPGSMVVINAKGDIVWYQPFKKGVKVSHWTKHQTILSIVGAESIPSSGGDEIVEVNLKGEEVRHLTTGKGGLDKMVHHEVRYDADGNIYALTFDKKVADLRKAGGLEKDTIHGDGIIVLDKAGKKIWEWSVIDHLDPFKDPLILKHKKDWVHANALFKDKDGNFIISYRDLNQIWKVEYKTGKVLWKLGDNGDFPLKENEHFSSQHSAHINASGDLMILDNGTKTGISRAMSFQLNPLRKTAVTKFIIPLSHDYYTTAKGNTALFGKDKVLFCLTDSRSFLVTDKAGKILWEMKVGGDPYRLEEVTDFILPKPIRQ